MLEVVVSSEEEEEPGGDRKVLTSSTTRLSRCSSAETQSVDASSVSNDIDEQIIPKPHSLAHKWKKRITSFKHYMCAPVELPLSRGERFRFGLMWGMCLAQQDFEKYLLYFLLASNSGLFLFVFASISLSNMQDAIFWIFMHTGS